MDIHAWSTTLRLEICSYLLWAIYCNGDTESGQLDGILVSFIGKEFPIMHLHVMMVLTANRKRFLT